MSLPTIKHCPCTLQPGFSGYSPAAQQTLFGSRAKKVSHVLPFDPPGKNSEQTRTYNEKRKSISISGVQEKYSLKLTRNQLTLTDTAGTHILKPVPAERLDRITDLPANEHVSMQMARQVFGIRTAACGMLFFQDGSPGYITRRFDYKPEGSGKYHVEDFATLLAKSPENEGDNFKYNASYLDIAEMIHHYVAAAPVVLLEFFRLVVFNYLIGNGDAHLKNFSLMETGHGDYTLSPAYDLLCTALHLDDGRLALHDGLYPGDFEEASYRSYGTYTRNSFIVFAEKAGINTELAGKAMNEMMNNTDQAIALVERSFLSDDAQLAYKGVMRERQRSLQLK
ncbi:HipA domain-containing protein [Parasegetibacter sp. NRK P23]|uniref:HipA domain-containing protein n=1 Tax=Parasegetibacter sp. NRK P23 TaxID=2942999 RepID=UPI0020433061|nr:HipA domain-containing protein [Parasegetibacter sp. NRK P23]MCM5527238.1 HipA domain-containing protein [Parasegetibacter sp. NRK P23]